MKVYVASKFQNKDEVRRAQALLRARGCEITHDWTNEDAGDRSGMVLEAYLNRCAEADVQGVLSADAVLVIGYPGLRGCLVEFGMASIAGKPIYGVNREHVEQIFCHLPYVEFFASVEMAIDAMVADLSSPPSWTRMYDLVKHVRAAREWSRETFGPGARHKGVLDHIRKELGEIEAKPNDLAEWIDVIILALDGAWRAGHEPEAIAAALRDKQARNQQRKWPDWRTRSPDEAIEHER